MKKALLVALVIGMIVLHQDFWNWHDRELLFGFLPTGLAYHIAYSLAAAVTLTIFVFLAWPEQLEEDLQDKDRNKA